MSARDELFGFIEAGSEESDLPTFATALDAYRDEVLREAAERIRNSEELRDLTDDHMSDCNAAADLIDTEVQS